MSSLFSQGSQKLGVLWSCRIGPQVLVVLPVKPKIMRAVVVSETAASLLCLDREAKNQARCGRVRWGPMYLVWSEKPKIRRAVVLSDRAACPRCLAREAKNQACCGRVGKGRRSSLFRQRTQKPGALWSSQMGPHVLGLVSEAKY